MHARKDLFPTLCLHPYPTLWPCTMLQCLSFVPQANKADIPSFSPTTPSRHAACPAATPSSPGSLDDTTVADAVISSAPLTALMLSASTRLPASIRTPTTTAPAIAAGVPIATGRSRGLVAATARVLRAAVPSASPLRLRADPAMPHPLFPTDWPFLISRLSAASPEAFQETGTGALSRRQALRIFREEPTFLGFFSTCADRNLHDHYGRPFTTAYFSSRPSWPLPRSHGFGFRHFLAVAGSSVLLSSQRQIGS